MRIVVDDPPQRTSAWTGEIEQKRDDPGFMDREIARDGVYPTNSDNEALRPGLRRAVSEEEPFASIAHWLARVAEDARTIDAVLDSPHPPSWSAVAFHAQQLAEKHLNVLFIVQHVRPPRSHDLDALISGLRMLGCSMPHFTAECKLLKGFAVDSAGSPGKLSGFAPAYASPTRQSGRQ